jgi:hypothetical protein
MAARHSPVRCSAVHQPERTTRVRCAYGPSVPRPRLTDTLDAALPTHPPPSHHAVQGHTRFEAVLTHRERRPRLDEKLRPPDWCARGSSVPRAQRVRQRAAVVHTCAASCGCLYGARGDPAHRSATDDACLSQNTLSSRRPPLQAQAPEGAHVRDKPEAPAEHPPAPEAGTPCRDLAVRQPCQVRECSSDCGSEVLPAGVLSPRRS